MQVKNTNKKWIIVSLVIFCAAVAATAIYTGAGYRHTEATPLNRLLKELTASYRLRQIVASMFLYIAGFLITYPLWNGRNGDQWAYVLAMPAGNALWGVVSALLLFTNIPYNMYTMAVSVSLILGSFVICFRKSYRRISWSSLLGVLVIVLAVAVMASSAVFPKFTSSDSYYFVMQYGHLIARHGGLASDIVGTYMTWTGIMPALTSAYAAMWGFENIYAIHYLLICSMYGFIALAAYKTSIRYYGRKHSFLIGFLTLVTAAVIPGVSYLSIWIIGNAYFMVYIVILMLLPSAAKEKLDYKLLAFMSLLTVWLAMCRPETTLVMCFFLICISSLGLRKRQLAVLCLPMCFFQVLFWGKIAYEYSVGGRQAADKLLTPETGAVILLSMILTWCYIGLYNTGFVRFARKHMTVLGLLALCAACLGLGIWDSAKFINNIQVFARNTVDWYWRYVLVTAFAVEALKSCFRCRNKYYDLIVGGFILCNFAVCMGRPQYLRLGVGDSYNRICMSILPLYVVSTILTFVEYLGAERRQK